MHASLSSEVMYLCTIDIYMLLYIYKRGLYSGYGGQKHNPFQAVVARSSWLVAAEGHSGCVLLGHRSSYTSAYYMARMIAALAVACIYT